MNRVALPVRVGGGSSPARGRRVGSPLSRGRPGPGWVGVVAAWLTVAAGGGWLPPGGSWAVVPVAGAQTGPGRAGHHRVGAGNDSARPAGGGVNALPLMAPGGPGALAAEAGPRLPFNVNWGDTQEHLRVTLNGVSARVVERRISANGHREVWKIEGLLRAGPPLAYTQLVFLDNSLAGVELQYAQPDWDLPRCNELMGRLRRNLEQELAGPGEMISRDVQPVAATQTPDGGELRQTLTGYEWKRADTVVQLFYFAVEAPGKSMSFRTISVHYRYRDPSAPEANAPGGAAAASGNPDPAAGPAPAPAPADGGVAAGNPVTPPPAQAPLPPPVRPGEQDRSREADPLPQN